MRSKLTVLAVAVALLVAAGAGGSQVVRGQRVISPPPGDFTGRWVKFDKSPDSPSYSRVYCIAYSEGGVACDFADTRPVVVYTISGK